MADDLAKANIPRLVPDNQFPAQALDQTVQEFPKTPGGSPFDLGQMLTITLASAADSITPWGRNVSVRDRQLRDFWPTEPYVAGAITNVAFRNASYDWEIRGPTEAVEQAVTDMFGSAIAGDSFGWTPFIKKLCTDLYSQDNGSFIELIRDPGEDANSAFKDERAPVLGIGHLDANQCVRTGNPEYPVVYTDRNGDRHKLAWYQIIPFTDLPSPIEKMNGVGVCAVTRVLRLSQIMRSIALYKDEKISGRHLKAIHFVSGVGRQDITDMMQRSQEDADNHGLMRYILPMIIASLDPEKPVSTATIDFASLPDGFDFDEEMKWYISGLALGFGVDYQEFAPLPGGNIGSSEQSRTLHQKGSGKGPAMFMKIAEAFKNYGALPRNCTMIFEDRDEQRELDKQTLKKLFQEEMALALRNGFIDPDSARQIAIKRGLYSAAELATVPEGYGIDLLNKPAPQPLGQRGGNTIADDADRTKVGTPNNTIGARLRKMIGA